MKSFELVNTTSGVKTAKHTTSGILVHSDVNPLSEAMNMACLLKEGRCEHIFLVGHGLGYLPPALSRLGIRCESVEVFEDLSKLAIETSGQSVICAAHVKCAKQMQARISMLPPDTKIVIAPYIMALRHTLNRELADYLQLLHVTLHSQKVYAPLIKLNEEINNPHLHKLSTFATAADMSDKMAVALGAGPTLCMCIDALRECREHILLIAASGAVSVMKKNGLTPDWIVALEARDTIVRDMESANDDALTLVFPWSHPDVLQDRRLNCVLARDIDNFETGGGSSGLVAADLASRLTDSAVFLIGMDMSDDAGEYSNGSNRDTANIKLSAPKFGVMRAAVSEWLQKLDGREVYHIVTPGTTAVIGARPLFPAELSTQLARCHNSMAISGVAYK